jgi:hypothetical protein
LEQRSGEHRAAIGDAVEEALGLVPSGVEPQREPERSEAVEGPCKDDSEQSGEGDAEEILAPKRSPRTIAAGQKEIALESATRA